MLGREEVEVAVWDREIYGSQCSSYELSRRVVLYEAILNIILPDVDRCRGVLLLVNNTPLKL